MRILIRLILIIFPCLFSFEKARSLFPKMPEEVLLKPKAIEKKENFSYMTEKEIQPFYIRLGVSNFFQNDKPIYQVRFGSKIAKPSYLLSDGNVIYSLEIDSNKVRQKYKLFDFSKLSQSDTIEIIKYFGDLDGYYKIIENISVEKDDTIFCYNLINRSYKIEYKLENGSTHVSQKELKPDNSVYKKIWVSKKRGFIKIEKMVEYFNVTFGE